MILILIVITKITLVWESLFFLPILCDFSILKLNYDLRIMSLFVFAFLIREVLLRNT